MRFYSPHHRPDGVEVGVRQSAMYIVMYITIMEAFFTMAGKIRKQVYLETEQDELLKQIARATGVTQAEIIRNAIDRHAHVSSSPRRDLAAWYREREFLNRLIQRGPVSGSRRWTREELHER